MTDDKDARKRMLRINIDRCITCGQCQANCPTQKGILLGREYDLTTTVRKDLQQRTSEKELIICEACDEIVGPKEHILWIARRLGPLAYSNPTLMLTALREAGAAVEPKTDIDKGLKRGDKVRILCPRCRQEVSFLA
jgi:hydrogenase-4 component H